MNMYDYRPKLDLPKTRMQKVANIVGYGIFIAGIIYSIINLATLPQQVPIHFNIAGEADGWGSKYILLLLPFIGIVTTLALEAVEKRPHIHNYSSRMNENNVYQFYAISIRSLNLVKNGTLLIFGLLQIEMVQTAREADFTFGNIMMGLLVILIVLPILWHVISISKLKESK